MKYNNDMTMMLAMHAALRRELIRIRRVVERPGDNPQNILRAAAGWQMFKSYLHVHHGAEDDVLWPAMRRSLDGNDNGLALLDAMEAEHVKIDPLLEAIDAAIGDVEGGVGDVAELVNRLSSSLLSHLDHEEYEGLPLIDATVTTEVWQAFTAEHGKRVGPDASRYFPWVFDAAPPSVMVSAFAHLPPPVGQAFHQEWEPAYNQLTIWPRWVIDPWGAEPV